VLEEAPTVSHQKSTDTHTNALSSPHQLLAVVGVWLVVRPIPMEFKNMFASAAAKNCSLGLGKSNQADRSGTGMVELGNSTGNKFAPTLQ
jgi:hypothetical protein